MEQTVAGRLTCCLSLTNVKAFLCKLSCKPLLPPTAALENGCGFKKKFIIFFLCQTSAITGSAVASTLCTDGSKRGITEWKKVLTGLLCVQGNLYRSDIIHLKQSAQ